MTFSGRDRIGSSHPSVADVPLVIAIPGGTYTSA
jgi:hypothetical protein